MKIIIQEQQLIIEASGIEFLKLKTEVNKRIGNVSSYTKTSLTMPLSYLPIIEDLLNTEAKKTEEFKKAFDAFSLHASAREHANEIVENNVTEGLNEKWSSILDPAQATAVIAMTFPEILGLCLFDEQGSGKTVMSIASFDILKEKNVIDGMIIVCPKSMISEWPKDIERFLPNKYKIVQAEGDKRQKYEASLSDFDVLVTNYEGVDVMLTSLIAATNKHRYLLVVDESYYLKKWRFRSIIKYISPSRLL